jgi:hypothetical protein
VIAGIVLDAGALIAVERSDRKVTELLRRVRDVGAPITLPAPALAQVLRDPVRQVRLQLLFGTASTATVPLDRRAAGLIGAMLRRAGTKDVVDAHVVLCGLERRQAIVTSDPDDLRQLDPAVRLIEI